MFETLTQGLCSPDETYRAAAYQRWHRMEETDRALGRLAQLGAWLSSVQRQLPPQAAPARVIVFAADHGVAAEEPVSSDAEGLTARRVRAICRGDAAVARLAERAQASLEVVDVGVDGLGVVPDITAGIELYRSSACRAGTGNIARAPALSEPQLAEALSAGAAAVERAAADGIRLLALGDIGRGNSTAAAALAATVLDAPTEVLAAPGSWLDPACFERKVAVIDAALARAGRDLDPGIALLELGGCELAALVGALLQGSRRSLPILLDGFIVGVCALVAARLAPKAAEGWWPASQSAEPAHKLVLEALGRGAPIVDLELRLGEATGALLALPLVASACELLTEG